MPTRAERQRVVDKANGLRHCKVCETKQPLSTFGKGPHYYVCGSCQSTAPIARKDGVMADHNVPEPYTPLESSIPPPIVQPPPMDRPGEEPHRSDPIPDAISIPFPVFEPFPSTGRQALTPEEYDLITAFHVTYMQRHDPLSPADLLYVRRDAAMVKPLMERQAQLALATLQGAASLEYRQVAHNLAWVTRVLDAQGG